MRATCQRAVGFSQRPAALKARSAQPTSSATPSKSCASLQARQRRARSVGLRLEWHQPAAGRRSPGHTSHVRIDGGDRRHHCGSRRNETPHGGRKPATPSACFESPIDNGCGEPARQSDPKNESTASDLIFRGHHRVEIVGVNPDASGTVASNKPPFGPRGA